ncbi:MAG: hypothetical protein ABIH11_02445 [Candidatus Altiarchaeota archaeon]
MNGMDVDKISFEELEVEIEVDDGKGGKKKKIIKWGDFMNSEDIPKEQRMTILEARRKSLEEKSKKTEVKK